MNDFIQRKDEKWFPKQYVKSFFFCETLFVKIKQENSI